MKHKNNRKKQIAILVSVTIFRFCNVFYNPWEILFDTKPRFWPVHLFFFKSHSQLGCLTGITNEFPQSSSTSEESITSIAQMLFAVIIFWCNGEIVQNIIKYYYWAQLLVSNIWNNCLPSNNHSFWCERRTTITPSYYSRKYATFALIKPSDFFGK